MSGIMKGNVSDPDPRKSPTKRVENCTSKTNPFEPAWLIWKELYWLSF